MSQDRSSSATFTRGASVGETDSSLQTFTSPSGLFAVSSTRTENQPSCGGSRLRLQRSVKMSGNLPGLLTRSDGWRRWLRTLLSCWPWWWFISSEISVSGSGGGDNLTGVCLGQQRSWIKNGSPLNLFPTLENRNSRPNSLENIYLLFLFLSMFQNLSHF